MHCAMGTMIEITNSLEVKINALIKQHKQLKEYTQQLEETIQLLEQQKVSLETQLEKLQSENHQLKSANALLGSKEYKRETKLKINSLIREIDQCIVQLTG